ncbi:isoleucine--tRNA ligase [Actinotignum urinale]|uniref:isoleucine--tRNA ligase n=1 Tax=Actinotignum urinale TaxID=190146 RepID=UPI0003B6E3B4|nr:isoleucine--tRNA ligase [Actinotignum urinale]MDY5160723.1 isoleucine--tRNA ligase [Actinotignum urinale]
MDKKTYPLHREGNIVASPNFPKLEEETLAFWKKDNTFQASIDSRESGPHGSNEFVFYDGPPFANGLPHYGHLLTGYVKDLVGRYQTMLGRRVERRFGWDTHGLPAELEAQRLLGIDSTEEIEEMGIEKFNRECRSSVLRYTKEWEDYVTRQARWVDFNNDYKTLDTTYMESVLWAFKTLYNKGLAYDGYRVLPYCWNDETPLSNHELKMDDDIYQDRQDQTVTVGLRLETGELALIWTTTPWTLPSNLAIAVGPDITYSVVVPQEGKLAGERVIIAEALVSSYEKELGEDAQTVQQLKGSDLVGRAYAPIFDYFMNRPDNEALGPHAYHIISGDFVTTEDGTGLVHIAPAFGEDDMFICMDAGIRAVVPVDEGGRFTKEVYDYEGTQVFDANKLVIRDLRDGSGPLARRPKAERAVLVQEKSYVHSYPHCWRCRKPLIYKAVSSWFVKVTAIRDRMVELNEEIEWTPDHIKHGQFGKWLAGARDWSISRNRFWGSPIPVWRSDDPNYPREDVYGSLEEIERDFGRLPRNEQGEVDLHRPYIDELTRPNPDDPTGKSTMRRIADVLDCWFESGSMPYAQVHYPFENKEWFEDHYPGDFIVEYIGQTRGWFYTLHILATALFDRPAFHTCISHGIVLGDDGQKMSKSLRNYPDVYEMFDEVGADAMRFFLMSSPIVRGGNLIVTEKGLRDTVRHVLLPLWNSWYFFALYASTCAGGEGYLAKRVERVEGLDVMDRYLLASVKNLADTVRTQLDAYDIPAACEEVRGFLDLLTNWYIRTSRDRFWNEDENSFDTFYTALETLMRVMAPLAPLATEEIWKGLTGGRSVHLEDWPVLPEEWANEPLRNAMNEVRDVVSAAHSLRKTHKLRVRQPLRSLSIVTTMDLTPFAELIASEVNVKDVHVVAPEESGMKAVFEVGVQPRELDKEMRKLTSKLFKAAKSGAWEDGENGAIVLHADPDVVLSPGQFTKSVSVQAEEGTVATVLNSGAFVALDTELDEDLIAEGYARDIVRAVQDTRKQEDLHVADRIVLALTVPSERVEATEKFLDLIKGETLAVEATVQAGAELAVNVKKVETE